MYGILAIACIAWAFVTAAASLASLDDARSINTHGTAGTTTTTTAKPTLFFPPPLAEFAVLHTPVSFFPEAFALGLFPFASPPPFCVYRRIQKTAPCPYLLRFWRTDGVLPAGSTGSTRLWDSLLSLPM